VYFVPVLGSCVCLNRVPLAACVCVCVCVCVCILCLLQDGRVCLCASNLHLGSMPVFILIRATGLVTRGQAQVQAP